MMRVNLLAGAVCAALMASGCQSAPPPERGEVGALPQHESYFASDQELRELAQSLAADGQRRSFALGLLEPEGGRRLIVYRVPLTGARPHELQRNAGGECDYSNLGFGLLGYALTRLSGGKTIGELIREWISGPLRMKTAGWA
jgi:CubicO group peptidase (beta-lactamase class C family)